MSMIDHDGYVIELVTNMLKQVVLDSAEIQTWPPELAEHHELQALVIDLANIKKFALSLANGDLSQKLETLGHLAGALKAMQANLRHLTWQAQMIADGDLTQRVDYLGDFSVAFNAMVVSLAKTEKSLRESEESIRQIVEAIPIPVYMVNWFDKRIIYINQKSCEAFQATPDEMIGRQSIVFWANIATRDRFYKMMDEYGAVNGFEAQFIRKNEESFWVLLDSSIIEYRGEKVALSTLHDIQQRKEMEQELKYLATTDYLTGATNRRCFFEQAKEEFKRVQRYKNPVAILILDIDHFKAINDNYGHQGGDEALIRLVKVCKDELREVDVFGRIGGEEFAILLPESDRQSAILVAERIRRKIEGMVILFEENTIQFTVSIGVSTVTLEDKSVDNVLSRADKALYEAKNRGRNQVV